MILENKQVWWERNEMGNTEISCGVAAHLQWLHGFFYLSLFCKSSAKTTYKFFLYKLILVQLKAFGSIGLKFNLQYLPFHATVLSISLFHQDGSYSDRHVGLC